MPRPTAALGSDRTRKAKVLRRTSCPSTSATQPAQPAGHSTTAITAAPAARLEAPRVPEGFCAPQFQLPEPLTGKIWTLEDFEASPALLVMFICNHCPFVKHLKKDIAKLTSFYMEKGLASIAISSNSTVAYPKDGPEYMAEEAKLLKYSFPYLYDESQEVAKAFRAVCTPEFYLFKKHEQRQFELFYHGQFDDSRPSNNVPVTGRDLRRAIEYALTGQELPFYQKASVGCSIKWHE